MPGRTSASNRFRKLPRPETTADETIGSNYLQKNHRQSRPPSPQHSTPQTKDKFILLYPDPGEIEGDARVCYFLNIRIDKNQLSYEFISRDIGTITIKRKHLTAGTAIINVYNIYNEPATRPAPALTDLTDILRKCRGEQYIIVGDFNIHHLS
ncbi:MAG: hypothetical protein L6R38_004556 [Xanthoria sp. 2 TBL-2021]|nr:MAG: hypothetical protein L6R38_004556 [Xanthoria sp. 2 TBL-2021]